MRVSGARAGNIMLAVQLLGRDQITPKVIGELYDLSVNPDIQRAGLLKAARDHGLSALNIMPSYGAYCWVLFQQLQIASEGPRSVQCCDLIRNQPAPADYHLPHPS